MRIVQRDEDIEREENKVNVIVTLNWVKLMYRRASIVTKGRL